MSNVVEPGTVPSFKYPSGEFLVESITNYEPGDDPETSVNTV